MATQEQDERAQRSTDDPSSDAGTRSTSTQARREEETMASQEQRELAHALFAGTLPRHTFLSRALALGMSASGAAAMLAAYDSTIGVAAAAAPEAQGTSLRSKSVIFDIDSGRVLDPTLFNPFLPASRTNHGTNQALSEPLFILNAKTGKPDPWLGESFTANTTLDVWTLKLRPGIKWSDGVPFTADDVVFTINMLKHGPLELARAASMQEWVKSVAKVDDRTVRFQLTKPNPRFQLDYFSVQVYSSIHIVPKHIWKGKDPLTFKNYDPKKGWPVFTGPYKLTTVSPTEFVYQRDPNWWGAKAGFKPLPKPERLVWIVNDTEDVRVARASSHQLDSVMDITLGGFQALKARNPYAVAWYDKLPYAWVDVCPRQLSLNVVDAPWNDKDMRWALSYAINRDQIVSIAYEGTSKPAQFIFPAYPPLNRYVTMLEEKGLFTKYPIGQYNPNKAAQLIEAKGYKKGSSGYYEKNGKQLSLPIIVDEAFIELKRVAQVVVQQLQNAGINATIQVVADSAWGEAQAFGRYQAAAAWNSCGSVVEPWTSMDHYNARWVVPIGRRAADNLFRWKNAQYSALLDQMGVLPLNDPKLNRLFVQAAAVWMADLPAIPLTQAKKLVPFDTYYWTGWPTVHNFYAVPETWWQSTHAIIHNLRPTGR